MRAFVVLLSLTIVGCVARAPDRPATYENAVRQFEAVVFGSDFGPGRDVLMRWAVEPRVVIFADSGMFNFHREDIEAAMRTVQALTGAKITFERDPAKANVALAFTPRKEFAETLEKIVPGAALPDSSAHLQFTSTSACMATLFTKPEAPAEITGAVILIGADNHESVRRRCIVEEIVQSAGLPADACEYAPSVFCETNHSRLPTLVDNALVRTLYDPRLKPGMSRAEAMPIAREIIREMMK